MYTGVTYPGMVGVHREAYQAMYYPGIQGGIPGYVPPMYHPGYTRLYTHLHTLGIPWCTLHTLVMYILPLMVYREEERRPWALP